MIVSIESMSKVTDQRESAANAGRMVELREDF